MNNLNNDWNVKIKKCKKNFEKNNFNFKVLNSLPEVQKIIMEDVIPRFQIKTVSWGDSLTLLKTGILEELQKREKIKFIQTFDNKVPREETIRRMKEALTVDLFLTGSNALTEKGQLVNLDGLGNRVAPIVFGPEHVIIIAGRNKIVPDLSKAMDRIKNYTAPLNAQRHHLKTPCVSTGKCIDCQNTERICNAWSIIEKSNPPGRISIFLINGDFGL